MSQKQILSLIACALLVATAVFAIRQQQANHAADALAASLLKPETEQPSKVTPDAPPAVVISASAKTRVSAHPTVVSGHDGYLGSESCKSCHEEYHQSWHASYHRTMTQLITPESAPEVISDTAVEVDGQQYQFYRRDDQFFVELDDPIAGGERRERRLLMMTGSHHMHVFWYESGIEKTPAQLPILYLIEPQRWIPRRSAFLRSPNMPHSLELGRWNQTCCQCHSTHPRQRPDGKMQSWDTHVADFGIACEACHGPGEAHVAFHQNDAADSSDIVDTIVQPMELPTDSRSDICGQCHGIVMQNFELVSKDKYFNDGPTFRPGDVLDDAHSHQIVRASKDYWESDGFVHFSEIPGALHGHFWSDGQVRVSGRDYNGMVESACYSQGDLTCMSCHTMHQQDLSLQQSWKDDQLKPHMRGDGACLQCHPKYKDLGTAHTHHAIDSAGSRCMNCHMPHTVYGILKTIRSHTISSPSVAETLETGRPNACSLCHLDHTLEQTADHLAQWYGHSKPELSEEEKNTAASVLHLLKGDAAQRALQVNAFQWQPAREISGHDWMRLYLLVGMNDPYEAIRLISERGYTSLPDVPTLDYDFLAAPQDRKSLIEEQFAKIKSEATLKPNPALLIDQNGQLDQSRFDALIDSRDHRDVFLQE